MNYPQKDPRWQGTGFNELKDFQNLTASLIHFDKTVPEEVTKSINLVKKLIEHSYFEYEFLDSALERSLINFELALRHKYIELTGERIKEAKKKDLGDLIEWANTESFI